MNRSTLIADALTLVEAAYPSCLQVIQWRRQRHRLIDSTVFDLASSSLLVLAAPLHVARRSFFHAASRLVLKYIAHCIQYILAIYWSAGFSSLSFHFPIPSLHVYYIHLLPRPHPFTNLYRACTCIYKCIWGEPERAPHRRVECTQSFFFLFFFIMVRTSPAPLYTLL